MKKYGIQIFLFIITIITTTLAGSEWTTGRYLFINGYSFGLNPDINIDLILGGLYYSIPFLGILTVHEFGHFFTAKYYRVRVTLPYYIPFWIGIPFSLGTMGAFIRIKDRLRSRKELFDIGLAGPLAGFVVALGVIWYGFTHLPPPEHIFTIHPEYAQFGLDYANYVYRSIEGSVSLGDNLLFMFFEKYVVTDPSLIPNEYEMMHYPFLFAGYMALFFTALNLMPIGQLDGGHILYGLVGDKYHGIISPVIFTGFVFYAGLGLITPASSESVLLIGLPLYIVFLLLTFSGVVLKTLNVVLLSVGVFALQFGTSFFFPDITGYTGWLLFAFLLGKVLGVYHPPAIQDKSLNLTRKILGWLSFVIFILCFSPKPFIVH